MASVMLAAGGCHLVFPFTARGADSAADSAADLTPEGGGRRDVACGQLQGWASVPADTFIMGSPPTEPCREPAVGGKETAHRVALSRGFEIQLTEVTAGAFRSLLGYNPAHFAVGTCASGDCPVESVTWSEAAAYCNALSGACGLTRCYSCQGSGEGVNCSEAATFAGTAVYACPGYRLPTEAEWEMAYRAGTSTALYNGSTESCLGDAKADEIAWYGNNADKQTHPVGTKAPNAWALRDMAGNVEEWTHDPYVADPGPADATDPAGQGGSPASRVCRGGSYNLLSTFLRAAYRVGVASTDRAITRGFRCARSRPP